MNCGKEHVKVEVSSSCEGSLLWGSSGLQIIVKKLSQHIDADLFVAVLILIFLIVLYNSLSIPEYAMLQF